MKCDLCGCDNASYVIKESINGITTINHYCANCVNSKAKVNFFEAYDMPFSHLFTHQSSLNKEKELVCPNCHLSLNALKQTGRFGCSECYQAFESVLPYYLNRMQSGKRHVGKRKQSDKIQHFDTEKNRLKHALEVAIKEERYEEAAKLRDEIKALKEI